MTYAQALQKAQQVSLPSWRPRPQHRCQAWFAARVLDPSGTVTAPTASSRLARHSHGIRSILTAPTASPQRSRDTPNTSWLSHGSHSTRTASTLARLARLTRHSPQHTRSIHGSPCECPHKVSAEQAWLRCMPVLALRYIEIHRVRLCWWVQGQADHEVLEVFRSAYEEVKRGYNEQLINERKTNLAALLLDIANKEGNPSLCPQNCPQADLGFAPSAIYQCCRGARRAVTQPRRRVAARRAPRSRASLAGPRSRAACALNPKP
jgi:hypothetical protein